MFNLGKTKSLIGLDIGSSSVKAIELKKTKEGYELVQATASKLSPRIPSWTAPSWTPPRLLKKSLPFSIINKTMKAKDVATSVSQICVIEAGEHAADDRGSPRRD